MWICQNSCSSVTHVENSFSSLKFTLLKMPPLPPVFYPSGSAYAFREKLCLEGKYVSAQPLSNSNVSLANYVRENHQFVWIRAMSWFRWVTVVLFKIKLEVVFLGTLKSCRKKWAISLCFVQHATLSFVRNDFEARTMKFPQELTQQTWDKRAKGGCM